MYEDNPLICLCNCHNFILYECLKSYLTSKIKETENLKRTVTTYTFSKFNCDICLKPYQVRFRIPGFDRTYELFMIIFMMIMKMTMINNDKDSE